MPSQSSGFFSERRKLMGMCGVGKKENRTMKRKGYELYKEVRSSLSSDDIDNDYSIQYILDESKVHDPLKNIVDVVKGHVLSLLPAKLLWQFRPLSREWDRLITSTSFAYGQAENHHEIGGLICQSGTNTPMFLTLYPISIWDSQ